MAEQTRRSILLYEPDERQRADWFDALCRVGWPCELVSSLEDLPTLKPSLPPRLILVSSADGEVRTDLLEETGERFADATVIVLTPEWNDKRLLAWMRAGVRDVIRTPIDGDRLASYVQQWPMTDDVPPSGGAATAEDRGDRPITSRAVHMLLEILEARDRQCVRYSKDVADLCVRIGRELGLAPRALQSLRLGALLHDIGRVGLRDEVIYKMGTLSPSEQAHVAAHVVFGERIVSRLLQDTDVLGVIRHHHEWYNGRGYPDSLRGEEVPLGARILAAADTFLSMTEHCPQSRRKGEQDALRDMCHRVGLQFCPKVVAALLQALGYRRPDTAAESAVEPAAPEEVPAPPAAEEAHHIGAKDLTARLDRIADLRALPTVVAEVLAMTSRKELQIDDLAAKIKGDHALSTKLLRLANSALYGSRMKVESIDRAVLKLGIDRVRHLVLGIGVIDHWRQAQDPGMLAGGAFWQHSMATGLLARQMSVMIDFPDDQNAFTAGLLHDTGQLILQEALDRDYVAVLAHARKNHTDLAVAERKFLEADHATIMRHMGPRWHLPQSLVEVMALHHSPWAELGELPEATLQLLLCVRVASLLSNAIGMGDEELGSVERIPPPFLEKLPRDRAALVEALAAVPEQVNLLSQAYGLSPEGADAQRARKRRPPQRQGFYVAESDDAVDPLRAWLESHETEFTTAADVASWRRSPALTWCWVRAESHNFAEHAVGALREVEGDPERVRSNLLLLASADAPQSVEKLAAEAGVACLREPWNVAALADALDRMRTVRPEAQKNAAEPIASAGPVA